MSRNQDRGWWSSLSFWKEYAQDIQTQYNRLLQDNIRKDEDLHDARAALARQKETLNTMSREAGRKNQASVQKLAQHEEEVKRLNALLTDAQSHIFSLQPYRKDLTPDLVAKDFEDLTGLVQDWVQTIMSPWLEDAEAMRQFLLRAQAQPEDVRCFTKALTQHSDLIHGCEFPETDEDIIVAIIMRWLQVRVFQTPLYGAMPELAEDIRDIKKSMGTLTEPKRDIHAIRDWSAELYSALLSCDFFDEVRQKRCQALTNRLAELIAIFGPNDKAEWFLEQTLAKCILPAVSLSEKLLTSTHYYYIHTDTFRGANSETTNFAKSQFKKLAAKVYCQDVMNNRKRFDPSKIDAHEVQEEADSRIWNVCTVLPGLKMRRIEARTVMKPTTVCRQLTLIAWGSQSEVDSFVTDGESTLVSRLKELPDADVS